MKGLENASENSEMRNAESIGLEINEFESKLAEAQRDGDTEASTFYANKINELKSELGAETQDSSDNFLGESADEKREDLLKELKDAQTDLEHYSKKVSKFTQEKAEGWIVDSQIQWAKAGVSSAENKIKEIQRDLSSL